MQNKCYNILNRKSKSSIIVSKHFEVDGKNHINLQQIIVMFGFKSKMANLDIKFFLQDYLKLLNFRLSQQFPSLMGCAQSSLQNMETSSINSHEKQNFSYNQFITNNRGNILDYYEFSTWIQRGQINYVRKAKNKITGQQRVCKMKPIKNKLQLVHAMRQIETLKKLDHPNIVQIHQYFIDELYLFQILENISGETLQKYIARLKRLPSKQARNILKQVLYAIQYLNKMGFAHRNIRPQNVMIATQKGLSVVKLIGFSSVCVLDCPNNPVSSRNQNVFFEATKDIQSNYNKYDIWACGGLLYFMLFGKIPTEKKIQQEISSKKNLNILDKEEKDLLQKMTIKLHSQSISAFDCLKHPVLNREKDRQQSQHRKVLSNLIKFELKDKLQWLFWIYMSLNNQENKRKYSNGLQFQSLDQNKDGLLDTDELILGLQKIYNIPESQAIVTNIFQKLDKNSNGYLDYFQFSIATSMPQSFASDQYIQKLFREIDSNKDGYIQQEELISLIPGAEEMHLLGSRKIDFREFKKMIKEIISQRQKKQ